MNVYEQWRNLADVVAAGCNIGKIRHHNGTRWRIESVRCGATESRIRDFLGTSDDNANPRLYPITYRSDYLFADVNDLHLTGPWWIIDKGNSNLCPPQILRSHEYNRPLTLSDVLRKTTLSDIRNSSEIDFYKITYYDGTPYGLFLVPVFEDPTQLRTFQGGLILFR